MVSGPVSKRASLVFNIVQYRIRMELELFNMSSSIKDSSLGLKLSGASDSLATFKLIC